LPLKDFQHDEAARLPDPKERGISVLNIDGSAYQANTAAPIATLPTGEFTIHAAAQIVPSSKAKAKSMAAQDDLVDAKIAASEARGDTKIARMEGKLDLVISKIDAMNIRFDDARGDAREARATAHSDNVATRANIWLAFFGIVAVIVAIYALFPTFFDMGSKMRDSIEKEVTRQIPQPPGATKKGG
jgi:hypothetical protein